VLAGTDTTHEAVERRASLETVLAALQMLPERQRDAMILRELEGRSYAHIAAELDATGGAVRQLLNRARNTLRIRA
jgi:RNA polymerase sigma factor (sigma-70 family)